MVRSKEARQRVAAIDRQDIPKCICPTPLNTTAIYVCCVVWVASGQKGGRLWGKAKGIRDSKLKTPYQLARPSSHIGGGIHSSRNVRQICIVHVCVPIQSNSEERIGMAALVQHVNDRSSGRDIIPCLSARGNTTSRTVIDIRIVSFRQGDGG